MLLAVVVAAAFTAGHAAAAEPVYTVVDLGAQADDLDWADLNDNGDVSGQRGRVAVVRRSNGSIASFPPFLPFERSEATASNNVGTTVGLAAFQQVLGFAGAVWGGSGTTVLPDLIPLDVNDAGQIVGIGGAGGGFFWEAGAARALRFGNNTSVRVEAVSGDGAAAGQGRDIFGVWPVYWPAGATDGLRLDFYGSSLSNRAFDLNDHGVVVGRLQLGSTTVATKWTNGALRNLPTLSGLSGRFGKANAINDRGDIVGATEELVPDLVGQVAALWTEDGVVDLNTVVDLPAGHVLIDALDINDRGQILVYSEQPATYSTDCCGEHYFLLTPVECAPIAEDDLASGDAGDGLPDGDGDGIPDCWEEDGIPVETDDGDLVNYLLPGADPERKDLYVEVDHMVGFAPEPGALEDVVASFANAPVANPDGSTGITLHVAVDDEVPLVPGIGFEQGSPGPGPADDFWDLKSGGTAACDGFFGTAPERSGAVCAVKLGAKRLVYRYAIFGDTYGSAANEGSGIAECGAVLGEGCAGIPGNDFLVTIGHHWDEAALDGVGGRRAMEAGAFMHELGHTLALDHGGADTVNCKPNYVSAMNYGYVLAPTATSAQRLLDYSRWASTLDEANLDEALGVGGPAGTVVFGWAGLWWAAPGGAVDWNRNGAIGTASANINWIQLLDACRRPSGLPPSKVDGNVLVLELGNFTPSEYDPRSVPAPSAFSANVCHPAAGNSFDCEWVAPIRVEIMHGVVFLTLPAALAANDWVRANYTQPAENPLTVLFENGVTALEDDGTEWNLENITHRRDLLHGSVDWARLKYNVRDAQGFADLAGNQAHPEPEITLTEIRATGEAALDRLDHTAPVTTAVATPPANAAGWHRAPVTVTLTATDEGGSGVDAISYNTGGGPVSVPGASAQVSFDDEGIATVTYFARDNAGNAAAPQTLVVRIDRTAPEALVTFEPATDELVVRAVDELSGPDPAAIAPIVTPEKGKEERRSYTVFDRAGNSVAVELLVKEKGKDWVRAEVVSSTENRLEVDWKRDKQGTLTALRQKLEVGRGAAHVELRADYDRVRDVTVITVDAHGAKKQKLEQPGVVLLRLLVGPGGALTPEY